VLTNELQIYIAELRGSQMEIAKSTLYSFVAAMAVVGVISAVLTGGFGITGKIVQETGKVAAIPSAPAPAANGVTEVRTTLEGFQYDPDVITVKKGARVRLIIDNKDNVQHGLHLPQFGITRAQQPRSITTVEFTAIETPTNGQAVPTCSQEHGEVLTFNVV